MKKTTTLKALVLSMVMVLGFVMPMAAQTDGFFKNNADYINRDAATGNITNQTFGQDPSAGTNVTGGITNQQFGAPLGSGLLIMVAAGAGYAMARRKRARKGMTLLLAAAMLLGMTQCKKNVETVAHIPAQDGQGSIFVTLTVENESRHDVGLSGSDLGKVTFETGDFIWVVNGNQVSGKLTYNGSEFQGYIDDDPTNVWSHFGGIVLDDNDYLYFCYTSNQNPEMHDYEGMPATPPYFSLDMSNQKNQLFVVSFGQTSKTLGELKDDEDLNNLSCMLYNKCALVKFELSEATAEDVTLTDVYSVCRLDINSGEHNVGATTYDTKAPITLYNPAGSNASDVRWGILMTGGSYTTNVTVGGTILDNAITIPALENNQLLQSVSVNNYVPLFAISATQKVQFAPGNLQYQASTDTWRLAEHQYDYVGGEGGKDEKSHYGNVPGSTNDAPSADYSGWIDLYMWATSNWDNTAIDPLSLYYHPWSNRGDVTTGDDNNLLGIGPSLNNPTSPDITGTQYDWGVHNDIYNPSTGNVDPAGTWRTPTYEEMCYIIDGRDNASSLRGYGQVDGVWGYFLLPDGWILPQGITFSPTGVENSYTPEQWLLMESHGAVFLPCGGSYRDIGDNVGRNDFGTYWLATHYGQGSSKDEIGPSHQAYAFGFGHYDDEYDKNLAYDGGFSGQYRYYHNSVRLVRNVQ